MTITRVQLAAAHTLTLLALCASCCAARAQAAPATTSPAAPGGKVAPAVNAPAVNQSVGKSAAAPTPAAAPAPKMPVTGGEDLDRIDAIVNGEVILDSDVNEELRFTALQPFNSRSDGTYNKALERLINRDLILQQAKLSLEDPVTDAEVDKEIATVRKDIPDCRASHCETDAGWSGYLAQQGFTPQTFRERWRIRMQVLRFIEERFRMGVRITPEQIKTYYEKTMLPEYTQRHEAAPPLDSISNRVEEVLLQQQVSSLLGDWLNSLRAQGSVVILKPGETAP